MLDSYDRIRDREVLDNQFIAWHAMVGSHMDPKTLPSFKKFTNHEGETKSATIEQREMVLKEAEEYYKLKRASQ